MADTFFNTIFRPATRNPEFINIVYNDILDARMGLITFSEAYEDVLEAMSESVRDTWLNCLDTAYRLYREYSVYVSINGNRSIHAQEMYSDFCKYCYDRNINPEAIETEMERKVA